MRTKPILRASSLCVALAATAFLVLHACSAAKRTPSAADANAVQAGGGAAENGAATAAMQNAPETKTTATATAVTATVTATATEEPPAAYFPATKAGIVLTPQHANPAPVQHAANAAP